MPRVILIAVNDIFFAAKIRATAQRLGAHHQLVKDADHIIETARRQRPDLIIFDLNDDRCRPLETIGQLKTDPAFAGIETIAYLSHVQVDLQKRATEAGFDRVLSKSAFTRLLPNLISGQT